jgi:hypothetical protein
MPGSGAELVEAIVARLPEGIELDDRERALLELARRQAVDLERLEADIRVRGTTVTGSTGQDVLNPSIAEARQARLAIGRLLAQLELPDTSEADRLARFEAEFR